jgi:hypothetical protein
MKSLDRLLWAIVKWYMRHRFPGLKRKLAIGAGGATLGLAVAGAVTARRRRSVAH